MGWLKDIFGKRDPYDNPTMFGYFDENVFHTETAFGYKVRYKMSCFFHKTDQEEFRRARMLEEQARKKFVAVVNREVVLPAFRAKGRSIRLIFARPNFPALCSAVEDSGEQYVACDVACTELNQELKASRFTHSGCSVNTLDVRFLVQPQTDKTIEENYKRMIKLHDVSSIKNTEHYAAVEEATMVAFAHRELELRKLFTHRQANQIHQGGHYLTVETRLVGRAVEIDWKFKLPLPNYSTMRAFRKDGGFWTGTLPLENNGVCIADSRSDSSTVLTLAAGTDHFFTFVIVRDGGESQVILESLRFSVRVATQEELAQVDGLIKAVESRSEPKSGLNKKTSDALEELKTYVEFDENVSQLERQLIERISNKDYSPEEKAKKIDRLQALVEALHINSS